MYILTIGRAFPEKRTGMIGIFEFEQAAALAAHDGDKVIYAISDNRSVKVVRSLKKIRKTVQGVEVYGRQLPIRGLPHKLFDLIRAKEMKKLLKQIIDEQGVPDVIHVHFPLLTLNHSIVDYIRTLGCKLVITEHWTKVQKQELPAWRIALLKYCVANSDAFICVSGLLRDSVLALTKSEKHIDVIPNMVSADFHYAPAKKTDADAFTFIAVGRLVELKRFPVVIKAFAKAFQGERSVRLEIVGDGNQRKELDALIKTLRIGDQVKMLGIQNREDVAKLYTGADCYVSASILETFGVPFIEAWVTGLPCIGVQGGPVDQYFSPQNGLLFEGDNVDSLAEAMRQIYQNRSAYNRKQISETASAIFTADRVAGRLRTIFTDCIQADNK